MVYTNTHTHSYTLTIQLWWLVNILSVSLRLVHSVEKLGAVLAGPGILGNLTEESWLLCTMLTVMCSQERLMMSGEEQAHLLSAHGRPPWSTHWVEGHVVWQEKKETRVGLQIGEELSLSCLPIALPCCYRHCVAPFLSPKTYFLTWLSAFTLFSLLNHRTPAKHSIIPFQEYSRVINPHTLKCTCSHIQQRWLKKMQMYDNEMYAWLLNCN